MIRSIIICAIIFIAAALLGWREKQQLSREKEANDKLLKEVAAIPNDDARMPKAAAIPRNRLDRRKEDLAMKERVKTLTRDYFALFRDYAENPSGESSDEFTKLQANIKSRLEGLDPSGIEQFMAECYNNPDLNLRIKGQVSSVVGQGSVISTRSVCYSFEHEKLSDKDRRMVVAAVRGGQTQRAVARRFGVGLGHLQYWLARTRGQKLDQVDWSDQSTAPRQQGRQTKVSLQRRVLALRLELRRGALGFVGAQAIHDALRAERPKAKLPCLRTIGRILKRQGALDAVRRVRRAAPPAGWYLPDVAAGGRRTGCVRYHRRPPAGGGAPVGRAHHARAVGFGLRRVGQRRPARPLALPAAGSALAGARLSGVCPVRQRFAFSRHAPPSGCVGPGHPGLSVAGRDPGLCPAARTRAAKSQ